MENLNCCSANGIGIIQQTYFYTTKISCTLLMLKHQNQHLNCNTSINTRILNQCILGYRHQKRITVGTTAGFIYQRSINFPKIYEPTRNSRHRCKICCCHGSLACGTQALPYTHLTVCVDPKSYGQHNIPTASSVLPQVLAWFSPASRQLTVQPANTEAKISLQQMHTSKLLQQQTPRTRILQQCTVMAKLNSTHITYFHIPLLPSSSRLSGFLASCRIRAEPATFSGMSSYRSSTQPSILLMLAFSAAPEEEAGLSVPEQDELARDESPCSTAGTLKSQCYVTCQKSLVSCTLCQCHIARYAMALRYRP